MAVLDATNRLRMAAHFMRTVPTPTLSKADIRAAANACDDWIDGQQTQFNAALPNPFKTTATLQQKTILFAYVCLRRAGLLVTEEDANG